MKQTFLFLIKVVCFVSLFSGLFLSKPTRVFAQGRPSDHIAILLIIDDSGSMQENDPTNLRYTAAQLMIATLDEGDAVGGIRFATNSQPITSGMVTIAHPEDKSRLIDAFQPGKAEGYTDVKAAFSLAKSLLESADLAGFRTTIIFLTDGKPEIRQIYPAYEDEAVSIALNLATPIDAIALTSGGQSAFLQKLTSQTGGKEIPAQTANDLLDGYLQILSNLKDRTVFGGGTNGVPARVAVSFDPALMPYVSKVTFVVSKSEPLQDKLFSPDDKEISLSDPMVSFSRNSDPRFSVITIDQPAGGDWNYHLDGHGAAQVRAILSSRLRVKVTSKNMIEGGQPLLITLNLIEEQPNLATIKVIGEANFSALVTLPDGSQQSLDTFYDDGTHGDAVKGDGDYTREFTNTNVPGTYEVSIKGVKGIIPITRSFRFEAIPFPQIKIDEPSRPFYEIRSNQIPLKIHLEGKDGNGEFKGGFQAVITGPNGKIADVQLQEENGFFGASFSPSENGAYQIEFQPVASSYQGLPFQNTSGVPFHVQIIPHIAVENVQLGLNPGQQQTRFEVEQAVQGIPILVGIQSSATQDQKIFAHLEGMNGFSLMETGPILVAPGGKSSLTLHLRGDPEVQPGKWAGKLYFTAEGPVELVQPVLRISLEIFTPTVTINARVISQRSPESCLVWAPVQLVLETHSNSLQAEQLNFQLNGIPGARLREDAVTVAPGDSVVNVELQPVSQLQPGAYNIQLAASAARSGVIVIPEGALPLEFIVDPFWKSCARPLVFWGVSGLVLIMIGIVIAVKRKGETAPAMVRGTLISWKIGNLHQENQVDLTGLKKTAVRIGKGKDCEIVLPDESVDAIHAVISAERNRGDIQLWLEPKAKVLKGYQAYSIPIPLEEQVIYQIGKTNFKYIRDAKI